MGEGSNYMRAPRRKRRLSTAILALFLWLGAGLAIPLLVSLHWFDLGFRDTTVAAPRDSYTLAAPIAIGSILPIRVERGTILLVDTSGSASSGEATETLLKSGAAHLVLDAAAVTIAGTEIGASRPEEPVAPLIEALTAVHFESLTLRRTSLSIRLPGGRSETLYDVEAEVSLKRKGLVSAKGTAFLRGHRVSFDATASTAIERKGPLRLPLKLALKSRVLDATFDGRLGLGDALHLQGQAEVASESVRQAARWLGAGWPSGPGLEHFSLKGQLDWTAQSLEFERSTFRMDGNQGTGALELNLAGNHPALVGTLAFKMLDLSPYFGGSPAEAHDLPFTWAALTSGRLGMSLGMLLDADLRLSAERVQAPGMEFGRSAASISLRGGRLLTDIAELQFDGGSGSGQIGADFTGFRPKLALRGKLDQVDLGTASARLAGQSFLQGPATLTADLTATGHTGSELLASLDGKLSVKAEVGGRLGLDIKGLTAATQASSIEGWTVTRRGSTGFDQLEVRLNVRDGLVAVESAQLTAGDTAWSAAGTLNIPTSSLDLHIVSGSALAPAISAPEIAKLPGLQLRGLWSSPLIKFAAEPDTAAAPLAPSDPLSFPALSLPDPG